VLCGWGRETPPRVGAEMGTSQRKDSRYRRIEDRKRKEKG